MNETKPPPESADPVAYIRANFEPADWLAVVVLNKRTNAVTQRIATAVQVMGPDFQSWLRYRNHRERSEVYISMNALHPSAHGRTKQDVAAIRHVYLDFDFDGTAAVERLLKCQQLPKPNYLINTSPEKWQAVWKVEGFGSRQAEVLQKGLAREAGADIAATDISRVLRLPGFQNHKYAKPHLIQVQSLAVETYHPEHFPKGSVGRFGGKSELPRPMRSPGSISRSERDWAFAKRALSRGISPGSVIAAIADFRRSEKPDPEYYAAHTVQKAAADHRPGTAMEFGPTVGP